VRFFDPTLALIPIHDVLLILSVRWDRSVSLDSPILTQRICNTLNSVCLLAHICTFRNISVLFHDLIGRAPAAQRILPCLILCLPHTHRRHSLKPSPIGRPLSAAEVPYRLQRFVRFRTDRVRNICEPFVRVHDDQRRTS
jgi:hypothetical protein